jgi:1,4-alpha-glucan branching enzyme
MQIVRHMNFEISPTMESDRNPDQFKREEKPARSGSTHRPSVANSKKSQTNGTVFRLAASNARNVLLAADFTGWNKSPLKMIKGPDGVWRLRINLAPGRYRYQFLIDLGTQNPAAMRRPPPFGTLHGVVEVRL